jgi:hypothetical protein
MRILAINCGSSSIKSTLIDSAAVRGCSIVTGIGRPAPILRLDRVDRGGGLSRHGAATSVLGSAQPTRVTSRRLQSCRIVHGEAFRGAYSSTSE